MKSLVDLLGRSKKIISIQQILLCMLLPKETPIQDLLKIVKSNFATAVKTFCFLDEKSISAPEIFSLLLILILTPFMPAFELIL